MILLLLFYYYYLKAFIYYYYYFIIIIYKHLYSTSPVDRGALQYIKYYNNIGITLAAEDSFTVALKMTTKVQLRYCTTSVRKIWKIYVIFS